MMRNFYLILIVVINPAMPIGDIYVSAYVVYGRNNCWQVGYFEHYSVRNIFVY